MKIIRNANGKRICDVSDDGKTIEIRSKDCVTRITINPDGTFTFENVLINLLA